MKVAPGARTVLVLGPLLAAVTVAAVPVLAQGRPVELVVVIHPQNRASVSPAELESIFLLRRRQWPDGTSIIPFNSPSGEPHRLLFDEAALRLGPDEAARYWLDQRIRSGTRAPRHIADGGLAVRLVSRLKGAVAYVPVDLVDGSVRVVARIRGGKVLPP